MMIRQASSKQSSGGKAVPIKGVNCYVTGCRVAGMGWGKGAPVEVTTWGGKEARARREKKVIEHGKKGRRDA